MTPNRAMVLLDIYRGTFTPAIHTATIIGDLLFLLEKALIAQLDPGYETTELGDRWVKAMMAVAVEPDKPFYFTFGSGHEPIHGAGIRNYCLIVAANEGLARDRINGWIGGKWAFCYPNDEVVTRHNLSRVIWYGEGFIPA